MYDPVKTCSLSARFLVHSTELDRGRVFNMLLNNNWAECVCVCVCVFSRTVFQVLLLGQWYSMNTTYLTTGQYI